MYNLTAYENATDMLSIFTASNNATDGYLFSLVFMLAGFFVIFIALKSRYDTIISIMGSSFVIGIIGVIGWSLNLVSQSVVLIPVFLLVGSVFAYMMFGD